jgi:DNA-binding NarL/FixJ family response regulator
MHRRAAELAEDELVALRHRVAAVTGYDDDLAADLRLLADQRRHQPAGAVEAAAWYQAAARVCSRDADREDLLLRALEAYLVAGDSAGAAALSMLLPGLDDTPRKRYLEGTVSLYLGDLGSAEAGLRAAWDAVDAEADRLLAAAAAGRMAWIHANLADLEGALLWTDRAIGLDPADGRATFTRILALAAGGRFDEARAAADLHGRAQEDPELLVARLGGGGVVRMWADDLRGARDDLLRAVEVAATLGVFYPHAVSSAYCAEAEYRLGRWDEAVHRIELVTEIAADLDQVWFLPLPHGVAALLAANRGQWEAAEHHVRRALEVATTTDDAASVLWSRTAEAALGAALGEHDRALAAATACLEHPGVQRFRAVGMRPWRILGAEAAAALGDVEAGDRFLDGVDDAAGGNATAELGVARARARLAAAAGDDAAAEGHFAVAARAAARSDDAFERGLHHLAHGSHLRRRGQRRLAAEQLDAARSIFGELQATPWIERVDRELASTSPNAVRRREHDPVELTPQERSVVRLVVQGRRNREVAAELFVNVKTVEYHLSSVYRKLGVSNRTQLAAAVREGALS